MADRIGGVGLDEDAFAEVLAEAGVVLDGLRNTPKSGDLTLLALPHRDDDLAALDAIAADFCARLDHVVVLGAGGSSLGGQTVCALAGNTSPKLHFADNIDPDSFATLTRDCDPAATGFITISKSGATAETLAANGCPVRLFHLETLDEVSLGALLMHFMVETIITAGIMGIDPFDQPAVDDGKVRTRAYLADGSQQ